MTARGHLKEHVPCAVKKSTYHLSPRPVGRFIAKRIWLKLRAGKYLPRLAPDRPEREIGRRLLRIAMPLWRIWVSNFLHKKQKAKRKGSQSKRNPPSRTETNNSLRPCRPRKRNR